MADISTVEATSELTTAMMYTAERIFGISATQGSAESPGTMSQDWTSDASSPPAVQQEVPILASTGSALGGLALAAAILVCNSTTVTAILRKRQIRNNQTHLLILCLACGDLLLASSIATRHLVDLTASTITETCRPWLVLSLVCGLMAGSTAMLTLFVLGAVRYVAVFHPFVYKRYDKPRPACCAIGFIWAHSFCVSTIPTLFNVDGPPIDQLAYEPEAAFSRESFIVRLNLGVLIIGALLLYLCIFVKLKKQRSAITAAVGPANAESSQALRRNARNMHMLMLVVLLLALSLSCLASLFLLQLIAYRLLVSVRRAVIVVVGVNAVLNNFIYAWKLAPIRDSIKQMLRLNACSCVEKCTTALGNKRVGPLDRVEERTPHDPSASGTGTTHGPSTTV